METSRSWKWPFYCGHCESRLSSPCIGLILMTVSEEAVEASRVRNLRPSQHNFSHFLPAHTDCALLSPPPTAVSQTDGPFFI